MAKKYKIQHSLNLNLGEHQIETIGIRKDNNIEARENGANYNTKKDFYRHGDDISEHVANAFAYQINVQFVPKI